MVPLPILTPTPGSVGYQQIVVHGIDTYYDIPKAKVKVKPQNPEPQKPKPQKPKSKFKVQTKYVKNKILKHNQIKPDFRIWKEPLNPIIPTKAVITTKATLAEEHLRNDLTHDALFRMEKSDAEVKPVNHDDLDQGKIHEIHHHYNQLDGGHETTLPPLVISKLRPELERGYLTPSRVPELRIQRPFLASTPATYLVNPSTTISTLRPVIRPSGTTRTIVKTTVVTTTAVPDYGPPRSVRPDLSEVTVLSHGEADGFPLPPIPTFRKIFKHF